MNIEQLMQWEMKGETEVCGEHLLQCHFVHRKSHMTCPGIGPGPPQRKKASD
jgi:hypothetical protein